MPMSIVVFQAPRRFFLSSTSQTQPTWSYSAPDILSAMIVDSSRFDRSQQADEDPSKRRFNARNGLAAVLLRRQQQHAIPGARLCHQFCQRACRFLPDERLCLDALSFRRTSTLTRAPIPRT